MIGYKCPKPGVRLAKTIALIVLVAPHPLGFPGDTFAEKLQRAETLAQQGNLAAAEQEFKELLRLDPGSYVAHNDLGALYMRQERYDFACREFLQAAGLNPRLAEIQKNLGVCFFQRGEFSKAQEALQKAKQLDPQDPRTRFLLGYSSFLLGQADEAASELEYVRKHKPGDETTLFYLVRAYTKKGQYEKGNEVFRELEQAHPDSVSSTSSGENLMTFRSD